MNDGMFTVPIVADDGLAILGWGRGPEMVEGANFHKCIGTPLRHLRMVAGRVSQISQEEKDALAAADQAAQEAAQQAAQAQAEADAAAAAQAAIDAANAPFEVSKFKLCMAFITAGKIAEFRAFIRSDDNMSFLWDAATVLDSNNPMVLAALDQISDILPEGVTAQELLRGCRV
jgi:multidrug efflux pump subunit AcrA (membrane-fusion protein)